VLMTSSLPVLRARARSLSEAVHRVLKEDLGEKVTEAEWTLLWLAAETEDRARRHEPEATAREDMRLPMHLAKILGGLRRGRGHRTAPVHDQDATKA